METNLKEKLAQLEAEVGVIKDPNLRQIAFSKLMETLVQPTPIPRNSPSTTVTTPVAKRTTQTSKPKNKTSPFYAKALVREEVEKLPLTGSTDGLPNFRDFEKGWEGQLWVLAAAKRNGIEGLNNHEIAYLLTKRLYKQTKYSTVNHVRKQVADGLVYLDPETQRWIITPDGEAHLGRRTAK